MEREANMIGKKRKKDVLNPTKGTPSAFILSLLIHGGLIALATWYVVFRQPPPKVKDFVPPPNVKPSKMPIEKIKMPVKRPSKPKASAKIVAAVDVVAFNAISFPDMPDGGIGDGIGDGEEGIGFIELPPLENVPLFGRHESEGNDFSAQIFDFKFWANGKKTPMYFEEPSTKMYDGTGESAPQVFLRFINQGWKESIITPYKKSAKLYTTHFCFPSVPSLIAADQFGERDLEPFNFMVLFKGKLVYPKDITFRFWCTASTAAVINVNGKDVLARSRLPNIFDFEWVDIKRWAKARYAITEEYMIPSDWITLKAGEPVPMKVALYARGNNGQVNLVILVEEKGKKYPSRPVVRGPLLPIFKTEELNHDMLDQIMKYLPEGEADLTNGPIFKL